MRFTFDLRLGQRRQCTCNLWVFYVRLRVYDVGLPRVMWRCKEITELPILIKSKGRADKKFSSMEIIRKYLPENRVYVFVVKKEVRTYKSFFRESQFACEVIACPEDGIFGATPSHLKFHADPSSS